MLNKSMGSFCSVQVMDTARPRRTAGRCSVWCMHWPGFPSIWSCSNQSANVSTCSSPTCCAQSNVACASNKSKFRKRCEYWKKYFSLSVSASLDTIVHTVFFRRTVSRISTANHTTAEPWIAVPVWRLLFLSGNHGLLQIRARKGKKAKSKN